MIPVLREAVAAARSQPVASLLSVVMVAGLCAAVLLTTGRTVAAEQAVLDRIDAAGTRTIVVRAGEDSGVTVALLDRLAAVTGIEAATGFGPITDVRNAGVPGAPRVAVRPAYGVLGDGSLAAVDAPGGPTALASAAGATALGLHDGTGGVVTDDGDTLTVVDGLPVPDHLRFLEPLVVVPAATAQAPDDPLAVLVVLAASPPEVAAVEATVRSLLTPDDPGTVTVETSADLAAIRAAVGGELGSFSRTTVLGILATTAVLLAVNLLALVSMRRRDFGRRRALGATQALVVRLLLAQVGLLAVAGAALGTTGALAVLAGTGAPPGAGFTLAVTVTAVLTALLAGLPPAAVAARRDPLHELRVP